MSSSMWNDDKKPSSLWLQENCNAISNFYSSSIQKLSPYAEHSNPVYFTDICNKDRESNSFFDSLTKEKLQQACNPIPHNSERNKNIKSITTQENCGGGDDDDDVIVLEEKSSRCFRQTVQPIAMCKDTTDCTAPHCITSSQINFGDIGQANNLSTKALHPLHIDFDVSKCDQNSPVVPHQSLPYIFEDSDSHKNIDRSSSNRAQLQKYPFLSQHVSDQRQSKALDFRTYFTNIQSPCFNMQPEQTGVSQPDAKKTDGCALQPKVLDAFSVISIDDCITISDDSLEEVPLPPHQNERIMPQLVPLFSGVMNVKVEKEEEPVPERCKTPVKEPCHEVIDVPSSPEMPTLIPFTSENEEAFKSKHGSNSNVVYDGSSIDCSQNGLQPKVVLERLSISNSSSDNSMKSAFCEEINRQVVTGSEFDCIDGLDFVSFATKEEMNEYFQNYQKEDRKNIEVKELDDCSSDRNENYITTERKEAASLSEWSNKSSPVLDFKFHENVSNDYGSPCPITDDVVLAGNGAGSTSLANGADVGSTYPNSSGAGANSGCPTTTEGNASSSMQTSSQVVDHSSEPKVYIKPDDIKQEIIDNSYPNFPPSQSGSCSDGKWNKGAFVSDTLEDFLRNASNLNVPLLEITNPNIIPIPRTASILSVGRLKKCEPIPRPVTSKAFHLKMLSKLMPKRNLFNDGNESNQQESDTSSDSDANEVPTPVPSKLKNKPQIRKKSNSVLASNSILRKTKHWKRRTDLPNAQRLVMKIQKEKSSISNDYKITSISSVNKEISPPQPPSLPPPAKETPKSEKKTEKESKSPKELPTNERGPPILIRDTYFTKGKETEEENLLTDFLEKFNLLGTRNDVMMLVNSNQIYFNTPSISVKMARRYVVAVETSPTKASTKSQKGTVTKRKLMPDAAKVLPLKRRRLKRTLPSTPKMPRSTPPRTAKNSGLTPPRTPKDLQPTFIAPKELQTTPKAFKHSRSTTPVASKNSSPSTNPKEVKSIIPRGKRSIRLPARLMDSAILAAGSEWVSPDTSVPSDLPTASKIPKKNQRMEDDESEELVADNIIKSPKSPKPEDLSISIDDAFSSKDNNTSKHIQLSELPQLESLEKPSSSIEKRVKGFPYCFCSNVSRGMPYEKSLRTLCCPCISGFLKEQLVECPVNNKVALSSFSSLIEALEQGTEASSSKETGSEKVQCQKELYLHNYAASSENKSEENSNRKRKPRVSKAPSTKTTEINTDSAPAKKTLKKSKLKKCILVADKMGVDHVQNQLSQSKTELSPKQKDYNSSIKSGNDDCQSFNETKPPSTSFSDSGKSTTVNTLSLGPVDVISDSTSPLQMINPSCDSTKLTNDKKFTFISKSQVVDLSEAKLQGILIQKVPPSPPKVLSNIILDSSNNAVTEAVIANPRDNGITTENKSSLPTCSKVFVNSSELYSLLQNQKNSCPIRCLQVSQPTLKANNNLKSAVGIQNPAPRLVAPKFMLTDSPMGKSAVLLVGQRNNLALEKGNVLLTLPYSDPHKVKHNCNKVPPSTSTMVNSPQSGTLATSSQGDDINSDLVSSEVDCLQVTISNNNDSQSSCDSKANCDGAVEGLSNDITSDSNFAVDEESTEVDKSVEMDILEGSSYGDSSSDTSSDTSDEDFDIDVGTTALNVSNNLLLRQSTRKKSASNSRSGRMPHQKNNQRRQRCSDDKRFKEQQRRLHIRKAVEALRDSIQEFNPGNNLINILLCGKHAVDHMTKKSFRYHRSIKALLLKREQLSRKFKSLALDLHPDMRSLVVKALFEKLSSIGLTDSQNFPSPPCHFVIEQYRKMVLHSVIKKENAEKLKLLLKNDSNNNCPPQSAAAKNLSPSSSQPSCSTTSPLSLNALSSMKMKLKRKMRNLSPKSNAKSSGDEDIFNNETIQTLQMEESTEVINVDSDAESDAIPSSQHSGKHFSLMPLVKSSSQPTNDWEHLRIASEDLSGSVSVKKLKANGISRAQNSSLPKESTNVNSRPIFTISNTFCGWVREDYEMNSLSQSTLPICHSLSSSLGSESKFVQSEVVTLDSNSEEEMTVQSISQDNFTGLR